MEIGNNKYYAALFTFLTGAFIILNITSPTTSVYLPSFIRLGYVHKYHSVILYHKLSISNFGVTGE